MPQAARPCAAPAAVEPTTHSNTMARVQSPPVLSQIRVARTYSEQAAALRALKDEIIGHGQRKEWWVQNGILESLVKILQNNARPPTSSNGKERSRPRPSEPLAEDEAVRLLCLQLLASFAYGELPRRNGFGVTPMVLTWPRRLCVPRPPSCRRCGPDSHDGYILHKQPSTSRADGFAGFKQHHSLHPACKPGCR